MGFIEASRADSFQIVLDFVGFVPSRFYLRDSCKCLRQGILPEVYISMGEFADALELKLVNPRYIFLDPMAQPDTKAMDRIASECIKLDNLKLELMLLDRTLMLWDSELIAKCVSVSGLRKIEWDAWVSGANGLMNKVNHCLQIVQSNSPYKRYFDEYASGRSRVVVHDLAFCQKLITDWARPINAEEWKKLLFEFISHDPPADAIEFLLNESGLDILGSSQVWKYIAPTNNVGLMKEFFDRNPPHGGLSPPNVDRAISLALRKRKRLMIEFLVNRFGVYYDICSDLFDEELDAPPDIAILDFLLSHGADINGFNGFNYSKVTCLDKAFRSGHWDLVDAIIQRGGRVRSLPQIFHGPAGKDVELFRTYFIANGCLDNLLEEEILERASMWDSGHDEEPGVFDENYLNEEMIIRAMRWGCSIEVVLEIFDLVFGKYPIGGIKELLSVIPCESEAPILAFYIPIYQKMVSIDPSLVHTPRVDARCTPYGACEVGLRTKRFRWSKKIIPPRVGVINQYFSIKRNPKRPVPTQSDRPKHLMEEWFDAEDDMKELEAISRLKIFLLEHGANSNSWFVPDLFTMELCRDHRNLINEQNIETMVKYGADINALSNGSTALNICLRRNDTENMEILLKVGALTKSYDR